LTVRPFPESAQRSAIDRCTTGAVLVALGAMLCDQIADLGRQLIPQARANSCRAVGAGND
jgi:hypothetical protein